MQQVVLASGSPRRKAILELLGLTFEVYESGYDEDLIQTDDPVEMVEELALQKALSVAALYPDTLVIGGDTTVYVSGEILAKANTKADAKIMFAKLLGKTHRVITGVAVVNSLTGDQYIGHADGEITFRAASEQELDLYVSDERNWRGFAGAYALQGGAASFALNQTGKLSAIIGMPVELTCDLLEQAGYTLDVDPLVVEHSLVGMKVGI